MNTQQKRILLIDDDRVITRTLSQYLAGAGYSNLRSVNDPTMATQVVKEFDPHVILLDISMPGMDGLAVAQALQQRDDPPAVIFCTAYDRYAVQAFERQAVGYLVKPVREDRLRAAIEVAARPNRLQRAGAATAKPGTPRSHVSSESHRGVDRLAVSDVRCSRSCTQCIVNHANHGCVSTTFCC